MAITYFGSAAVPADNGTNATATITVTPPASMLAGDLVVVVCRQRGAGAWINGLDGGQAWTNAGNNTGTSLVSINTFWCRFNGTWSVNPRFDNAGATNTSVVMLVFRPTSTSYNWDLQFDNLANLAAATVNSITGVTPSNNSNISLACWHTADDNTWGTLTGTNWTIGTLAAQYRNLAGSDGSCTFAYQIQTTAAPTNNVSKTQLTLGADATATRILNFYEVLSTNGTAPTTLLSGAFTSNAVTSSGTAATSQTVLNANYTTSNPTIVGNATVQVTVLNVNYVANTAIATGASAVNAEATTTLLTINYTVNNSVPIGNSLSLPTVLNTSTVLNSVLISGSANVVVSVINSIYLLNNATAKGNSNKTVTVLNIPFTVNNAVASASSTANATSVVSVVNLGIGLNPVIASGNANAIVSVNEIIIGLNNVLVTGTANVVLLNTALEIALNNALASGNSQAIATALQLNLSLGNTTAREIDISKNEVLLLQSLMTNELIFESYILNSVLQKSLITNAINKNSIVANEFKKYSIVTNLLNKTSKIY